MQQSETINKTNKPKYKQKMTRTIELSLLERIETTKLKAFTDKPLKSINEFIEKCPTPIPRSKVTKLIITVSFRIILQRGDASKPK